MTYHEAHITHITEGDMEDWFAVPSCRCGWRDIDGRVSLRTGEVWAATEARLLAEDHVDEALAEERWDGGHEDFVTERLIEWARGDE